MPTQRSVATRFWTTPSLAGLSPLTRLFMLYCLTGPRANIAGLFRVSFDDCAHDTGLTKKQIEAAIEESISREFVRYDPETRWLWVTKRVMYEFPAGPTSKQAEGIRRILEDAPKCRFILDYCSFYRKLGFPFDRHFDFLSKENPDFLLNPPDPALGSLLPALGYRFSKDQKEHKAEFMSNDGFDEFWSSYPNKKAKQYARKCWEKIRPSAELQGVILSAIERQKNWPDWAKDNGAYIPHPSTWLNGGHWEDEEREVNGETKKLPPTQEQLKATWKNRDDYVEGRRAGRVHPSERIAEWELQ